MDIKQKKFKICVAMKFLAEAGVREVYLEAHNWLILTAPVEGDFEFKVEQSRTIPTNLALAIIEGLNIKIIKV